MILVDKPNWAWRGKLWGHMVSDSSLRELHQFAQNIGKRRIGFQGDHYDINIEEFQHALSMGARVVNSRELVVRLREAGLRQRRKTPSWTIVYESRHRQRLEEVAGSVNQNVKDYRTRTRLWAVLQLNCAVYETATALVVEREEEAAVVLEFAKRPDLDLGSTVTSVWSRRGDLFVLELIANTSHTE